MRRFLFFLLSSTAFVALACGTPGCDAPDGTPTPEPTPADFDAIRDITLEALPDTASLLQRLGSGRVAAEDVLYTDLTGDLREAVFAERRSAVAKLCRDVLLLLKESGSGLDAARKAAAKRAVEQLKTRFGYEEGSASDAAVALVRTVPRATRLCVLGGHVRRRESRIS